MPLSKIPAADRQIASIDRAFPWVLGVALASLPFVDNFWPSMEGTKAAYRGSLAIAAILYIYQGFLVEWVACRNGRYGGLRFLTPLFYAARAAALFFAGLFMLTRVDGPAIRHVFLGDFYWTPLFTMSAVLARWPRPEPEGGRRAGPLYLALRFCGAAIFYWSLASCAAGDYVVDSLKDFRNDLGGALAMCFIFMGAIRTRADLRRMLAVALATACYVAAMNFLAMARFARGNEIERLYWINVGIVYSGDYWFAQPLWRASMVDFDYRPAFPFWHHNRLSNYAMMASAIGLTLACWPGFRFWRGRMLSLAGFTATFFLLNLTMGRGAWLGFAAGLFLAALLMFRWKRSHIAALGLLAALIGGAFFALPSGQRERLDRAFGRLSDLISTSAAASDAPAEELDPEFEAQLESVEPHRESTPHDPPAGLGPDEDGNVDRRLIAMMTAWNVLKESPWTGSGYGFHSYEEIAKKHRPAWWQPDESESEQFQSHAHNNLLQVAAESGAPALALYLLFHLTLFLMLLLAARRGHRDGLPERWLLTMGLALFLMIHCYGMTNYSLRYTLGDLTWTLWGLLAVLSFRAGEPVAAVASTPETKA